MKSDPYVSYLHKYLIQKDPDAMLWLVAYGIYVNAIDDIIDQDIPKDKTKAQFILEQFEFAEVVYSNDFYIRHVNKLRPLVKMTSGAYMQSVKWEESPEKWKSQIADSLRQIGNEVILAVIEIVNGTKVRNEARPELLEISYKTHHMADGTPV